MRIYFQYVRDCLGRDTIPQLMLLTKDSVYASLHENEMPTPSYVQRGNLTVIDLDSLFFNYRKSNNHFVSLYIVLWSKM